ncbi:MAG: T9SS type A sorting domain-containing protein [Flavobacteriaceae bacterium]|nr:T9SS type A sorting domain-containing protein [Flavobacteriaceae bacterium]
MKTKLLLTLSMFYAVSVFAQFGEQQIISIDAFYPSNVFSADLDGDGDYDILYSSINGVWWHENLDGMGLFGNKNLIVQNTEETSSSVSASDIDGDGDLDVLSTFIDGSPSQNFENRVVWNENLDGLGNFGTQRIITLDAYGPTDAKTADFDGDGDLDVLSISRVDDKIAWYENLDGLGNFGAQHVISTQLVNPISSYIADFDGDGHLDIVSQSFEEGNIAWFKNIDGSGTFSNAIFVSTNNPNHSVGDIIGADLDGDNDIDIVTILKVDNRIVWFENMDGNGDFSDMIIIAENIPKPNVINASDLDNDGDLDIISSSFINSGATSEIFYLLNENGLGDFDYPVLITNEIQYTTGVFTCDINLDGKLDLVSSSQLDSKIAWYENNTLGISENENSQYVVYPNPTDGLLSIESKELISKISVYNILGQMIETTSENNQVDLSKAEAGVYFLKIESENGNFQTFKIVRE